jgi:hypothetical protein
MITTIEHADQVELEAKLSGILPRLGCLVIHAPKMETSAEVAEWLKTAPRRRGV